MSQDALQVAPVADCAPGDEADAGLSVRREPTAAATIYQLQLALLASRVETVEATLADERRRRQHVTDRYEHLLAEREAEIERLRAERDGTVAVPDPRPILPF